MTEDERNIRTLVATWMKASRDGDLATVLSLMADDVLFIVPGREPFGKDAFRAASEDMSGMRIEGQAEVQEVQVMGDWAYVRNHMDVTLTPPNGTPVHRSGYTLSILRKYSDGRWRLTRDANLMV